MVRCYHSAVSHSMFPVLLQGGIVDDLCAHMPHVDSRDKIGCMYVCICMRVLMSLCRCLSQWLYISILIEHGACRFKSADYPESPMPAQCEDHQSHLGLTWVLRSELRFSFLHLYWTPSNPQILMELDAIMIHWNDRNSHSGFKTKQKLNSLSKGGKLDKEIKINRLLLFKWLGSRWTNKNKLLVMDPDIKYSL